MADREAPSLFDADGAIAAPVRRARSASAAGRGARTALGAGLTLTALGVGLVLSGSPPTVAGTNSVPIERTLGTAKGGTRGCEWGGTLPRGTTAIRLSLGADTGPAVTVEVLARTPAGVSLVTSGERAAGWGPAESVTVPVGRVTRTLPEVRTCFALGPVREPVKVAGATMRAVAANGHRSTFESLRVEYLRAGERSWFSLALSVARRMGLGNAAGGTWIVLLELALMVAVAALACRLVLRTVTGGRERSRSDGLLGGPGKPLTADSAPLAQALDATRRIAPAPWISSGVARLSAGMSRIPRAARICALVAFLNAACWSLITPPFQVPDEPSHFAYAQHLAETGRLPSSADARWSEEENVALEDLHQSSVRLHPETEPIVTRAEQQRLRHDLARPLRRDGEGGAGAAASQPPLYYALESIPYFLGSGGTILDRLELMRLFSALMAGLTALFGYLFLREALPRLPWAWAVGGLAIALMPLLGFMSGGVNPEAMFTAVSAAGLFLLARSFRRGLTPRLGACIGVVIAAGTMTKLNFVGLIPGLVLGLLALTVRAARISRRGASRSLAIGLGIAVVPGCAYALRNLLGNRPVLGSVSAVLEPTGGHGSLPGEVAYIWQLYLPRLPGMAADFPGLAPWRAIWFDRSVGLYGWLDTPFPGWVDNVALVVAGLLALLAARALVASRSRIPPRLDELAVYVVIAAGLLVLVGAASHLAFPEKAGTYGEPRYLLPLIPLAGAAVALSARGAGRRWGPAAGVLIVVLFLAWDVFSQLQVIARYYG